MHVVHYLIKYKSNKLVNKEIIVVIFYYCIDFNIDNLNNFRLKKPNFKTLISPKIKLYYMVENSGIEPLTSCVQGRRSPS